MKSAKPPHKGYPSKNSSDLHESPDPSWARIGSSCTPKPPRGDANAGDCNIHVTMHVGQKDRVLMLMYARKLLKQKVQVNTRLQCVGSLNTLWIITEHKAKNMRYWEG